MGGGPPVWRASARRPLLRVVSERVAARRPLLRVVGERVAAMRALLRAWGERRLVRVETKLCEPTLLRADDEPPLVRAADEPPLERAADEPPLVRTADELPVGRADDEPPLVRTGPTGKRRGVADASSSVESSGSLLLSFASSAADSARCSDQHLHSPSLQEKVSG